MKVISVNGTASNAGKTTVASYILRNLSNRTPCLVGERIQTVSAGTKHSRPEDMVGRVMKHRGETSCYGNTGSEFDLSNYKRGLCALKITVRHKGSCPRHTGCDTCDSDYEPFRILTDDAIIKEKGKDTDQFSRVGADKVVWLQTDSDAEKTGIEAALACFNKDDTIIVEGNSFLRVQDADVAILVVSPSVKKVKRSTKLILDKIDLIAINVRKNHSSEQIEECREQLRDLARHSESAVGMSCKAPYFVINPFVEDGYSNQTFIDRIQEYL
jgi:molybdopterin-guanine dinucleotide biosynthesis protein